MPHYMSQSPADKSQTHHEINTDTDFHDFEDNFHILLKRLSIFDTFLSFCVCYRKTFTYETLLLQNQKNLSCDHTDKV